MDNQRVKAASQRAEPLCRFYSMKSDFKHPMPFYPSVYSEKTDIEKPF